MSLTASIEFWLIGEELDTSECEQVFEVKPHKCLIKGENIKHGKTGEFLRIQPHTVWGFSSKDYEKAKDPAVHEQWMFNIIQKNKEFIKSNSNISESCFEFCLYGIDTFVVTHKFIELCNYIGADIGFLSHSKT